MKHWALKAAAGSSLGQFATALGEAAITEAAVERSFSAQVFTFLPLLVIVLQLLPLSSKKKNLPLCPCVQARVYNKLRERPREDSCEAQTWLLPKGEITEGYGRGFPFIAFSGLCSA